MRIVSVLKVISSKIDTSCIKRLAIIGLFGF